MAASMYCLRTVVHGCQRHIVKQPGFGIQSTCSKTNWGALRFYVIPAGVKRPAKKLKKEEKPKVMITKEELEEKRKDTSRIKPYGFTAWKPVDDVYVARYYPKQIIQPEMAVEMLKTFQRLDFTSPDQAVYLQLKLDMKLEKKRKVDPFVGYVLFPFPFVKKLNKVLVFTEKAEDIETAKNNGAAVVGGTELIPEILNDDVQADFYIATPDILSKLNLLKNKLRKKFPKTKRGSVGNDIANMIKLFENCYEYIVERECFIRIKIATLDMPLEHIVANMHTLIKDVSQHKPMDLGPLVETAILASATSESLYIDFQKFLPQEPAKSEEN